MLLNRNETILVRRRRAFVAICLLVPLLYLYWPSSTNEIYWGTKSLRSGPHLGARNSTLGFSKIFVISRPSRTDRRDAMSLTAAVSGIRFDWVDGVDGNNVSQKVLPPGDRDENRQWIPTKGSWRAHMNALQAVVSQGLPSALIMEDDVDWDFRLKSQLETFGFGAFKWLKTFENSLAADGDGDASLLHLVPPSGRRKRGAASVSQQLQDTKAIPIDDVPKNTPSLKPYGEDWDVLWLGHCGSDFPKRHQPQMRVSILNDLTVPSPKHLKPHPFALGDSLGELYPPHTRLIHATSGTVCTLAYAVSQKGAQKLLWQFGLESFTKQWDLMLADWCEGKYENLPITSSDSEVGDGTRGIAMPTCLTVQPPLISHYHAEGGNSDIQGQGGGLVRKVGSPYIRYSVRVNLRKLVGGKTEDELVDQWPDEGET